MERLIWAIESSPDEGEFWETMTEEMQDAVSEYVEFGYYDEDPFQLLSSCNMGPNWYCWEDFPGAEWQLNGDRCFTVSKTVIGRNNFDAWLFSYTVEAWACFNDLEELTDYDISPIDIQTRWLWRVRVPSGQANDIFEYHPYYLEVEAQRNLGICVLIVCSSTATPFVEMRLYLEFFYLNHSRYGD